MDEILTDAAIRNAMVAHAAFGGSDESRDAFTSRIVPANNNPRRRPPGRESGARPQSSRRCG